jgi:hypothetical protein
MEARSSEKMSTGSLFLRMIGVGEARIGMIWFMLAILCKFPEPRRARKKEHY